MRQEPLTRRNVLRLGGGVVSAVGLAAVASPAAFADDSGYTFGLWKGGSGDQRIWSNHYQAGWTTPQVVPGAGTSAGVAMAGTNQGLAIATWKGVTGDERIWWSSITGGVWSTPQVVPGANSRVGPALVTSGPGAIMMWRGSGGDQRIWWNYYSNGWVTPQVMAGAATGFAPTMAFRYGSGVSPLYVAWKGVDGDQRIFWSNVSGGLSGTWSSPQVVPGANTSAGVGLAGLPNGNLVMAWKGVAGDQQIWWSQSYPGSPGTWTAPQVVPGAGTSTGPSLATNGNVIAMTWKGVDGDERVWWSRLVGANWTAPEVIAGASTSFRPAVATSR